MSEVLKMPPPAPPAPEKRPRGRPKGSRTKTKAATIARILKDADPLGFWIRVANGKKFRANDANGKIVWVAPTAEQVMEAQRHLLNRTVPSLRATDMTVDTRESVKEWLASLRD